MIVHNGYDNLNLVKPVVAMGIFDGVHRGHLRIIECLRECAQAEGGESVLVTFYPHPRQVLETTGRSPSLLTTLQEKIVLLERYGIDHLIIIHFDYKFSNKEACEFIEEVLVKKIGAVQIIAGFNHRFGRRGKEDFNTIVQCAGKFRIKVVRVEPVETENGTVSSSAIRDALIGGKLDVANEMLGYSYFMRGKIVEGKKIGRTIGFPTANINPDSSEKLIPMNGVYAVEIIIGEKRYKGVMSIGINPTVNRNPDKRTIEVNIFRFRKEIYGAGVTVIFRYRLRDEEVFSTLDELAAQIKEDKKQALSLLG